MLTLPSPWIFNLRIDYWIGKAKKASESVWPAFELEVKERRLKWPMIKLSDMVGRH